MIIGLFNTLSSQRLVKNKMFVLWIMLGIVLLGLLLRLHEASLWNNSQPNSPDRLYGDEPGYDSLARDLLQGYVFTWPGRVPLYPVWLAGMYLFISGSYNVVPYVQSLLGVTVIPLTYALGRRVFGQVAGLMAASLAAISYILIRQALPLMSEILYTPVILLAVIALWDALHKPTARRFCWVGFWIGISDLVRPTLLFFPLAVVIVLVIALGKRKALRYWSVFVLVVTLVITPWMLRNYVRYQAVFPLAISNAFLWQGSPEYYHLIRDHGYTYMQIWDEVITGPGNEGHPPMTIEGDRYWTKRALRSIVAEPLVYFKYAAEKLGTYWVGDPNADWADTYVFNYHALRLKGYSYWYVIQIMIARALPIVALLASLVVWCRWRILLPIYALLAYCTLLHAATHAEARLSEPLQPFLLIIIAGATTKVWAAATRVGGTQ